VPFAEVRPQPVPVRSPCEFGDTGAEPKDDLFRSPRSGLLLDMISDLPEVTPGLCRQPDPPHVSPRGKPMQNLIKRLVRSHGISRRDVPLGGIEHGLHPR
jgi:hypothetical protein